MKKLILSFAFVFLFSGICHAKSFLILDKSTKDIISYSPEDDAVLSNSSWEKVIINDDYFETVKQLEAQPVFYTYKNGKFVKNIKKISDEENARVESLNKINKRKQDKKNALDKVKLIANLTDDELKALSE